MTELLMSSVAFAAGFGTGWLLRAALARAEAKDWRADPFTACGVERGKWTDNVQGYRNLAALRAAFRGDEIVPLEYSSTAEMVRLWEAKS